jgi:hypothetical protein
MDATSVAPLKNSPRVRFRGHQWNGSATSTLEGAVSYVPTVAGVSPAGYLQVYAEGGGILECHRVAPDIYGYVKSATRWALSSATGAIAAGTLVPTVRQRFALQLAGDVVSTATPTLQDGIVDGQTFVIVNYSAWTYTISDNGTLAGSKLRLAAATVAIPPRSSLRLEWSTGVSGGPHWVQAGQVVTVI